MNVKVQIPSRGAREQGRMPMIHELIDWLEQQGVARRDIFIFVVSSEARQYQREAFGCNIVSGVPGLGAQKNFADDYFFRRFGEGQLILHFDDDVVGLRRASPNSSLAHLDLPGTGLRQLCNRERTCMQFYGAQIFGVNMSLNPQNTAERSSEPSTRLGLIVGMFYGYLTNCDRELRITFALPQGYCEDYERSVRYFLRHGVIARFTEYVVHCRVPLGADTSTMSMEGGGNHNRIVGCEAVARRLHAAFPKFCAVEASYGQAVAGEKRKKNAVKLSHVKPLSYAMAPSCLCGNCCFCARRSNVLDRKAAIRQGAWCRHCRRNERKKCHFKRVVRRR